MLFACTISADTINTSNTGQLVSTDTYRFVFFRSIEAAGRDWDAAAPVDDLFLQRTYLYALESNPPEGMRFGYLIFYKGDAPVGVALCQIKYFKGDDNINDLDVPKQDPCFFSGLTKWFKRRVAGWAAADILICGNMLLTGEHGFYFNYDKITHAEAVILLETSLVEVIVRMEREGIKMPVILVKDLAQTTQTDYGPYLTNKGFVEFDIQPNMVLDLKDFNGFDAYLSAMSTKYRTRAKRAFKKGIALEKKEMTLTDILRELPRMYELYRDVANNAGFNMVDLNQHYLPGLKRELEDKCRIFAYYHDNNLVAFYTTITNGTEMDAHFLGYDKALNHDYQIYLNILYDIVRGAFEAGCETVVFARTALEIKSSVGAVPEALWCYLRHQNNLINRFTGTVLDYLKPVEVWQPRHPFKEE